LVIAVEAPEDQVKSAALADPAVVKALEGKSPRKVVVVKGRLVNIVV
jgi:leucyl-tRNA synthetase